MRDPSSNSSGDLGTVVKNMKFECDLKVNEKERFPKLLKSISSQTCSVDFIAGVLENVQA